MGITVIIPAFNEENCIRKTLIQVENILKNSPIPEYEIIVIDDGSTDNTQKEIQLSKVDCNLIVHKVNRGYGFTLKTGIRNARFGNIAITDADDTYPNDRIPELYKYFMKKKLDMLVGSRTGQNVSYPFIKKIPKFFIKALAQYICRREIPDINSGLRIFKKHIALKFFTLYPDGFSFTLTITLAMLVKSYEVEYMPIDYFQRIGKSKIRPIRDTIRFFNLLGRIAFYFNPLRFIMPFVVIMGLLSFSILTYDVFIRHDLSSSSVLLPSLTLNLLFLGLIADLIVKKFGD